jgi:hypothetical protein
MILFELLWKLLAFIIYWLIRPFMWFFVARECKRCEEFYCGSGRSSYCHKNTPETEYCLSRPWRPCFIRRKRKQRRKFFDI